MGERSSFLSLFLTGFQYVVGGVVSFLLYTYFETTRRLERQAGIGRNRFSRFALGTRFRIF